MRRTSSGYGWQCRLLLEAQSLVRIKSPSAGVVGLNTVINLATMETPGRLGDSSQQVMDGFTFTYMTIALTCDIAWSSFISFVLLYCTKNANTSASCAPSLCSIVLSSFVICHIWQRRHRGYTSSPVHDLAISTSYPTSSAASAIGKPYRQIQSHSVLFGTGTR